MSDTPIPVSPKRTPGEAGFTLVEALCAIVILAFGLIAVTNLLLVASTSNTTANMSTAATTLAAQQLENLKAIPFADANAIPTAALAAGGDLEADAAGFFTDPPAEIPGVGQIRVRWQIVDVDSQTKFIAVRAESTALLIGARSRAEFTVFRSCTDSAPPPGAQLPSSSVKRLHDMRATEMNSVSGRESGFSLIELMIAMVVTLIVTGAIFGLLSGGNSAFRREPQLADRQQNTRVAMSMIESDISNAGTGLPPFVQVFANGLDGYGPNGEDALEIVVGLPQCPPTPVCARGVDSGAFQVFETPIAMPACFGLAEPGGALAPGTPPARLGAALYPATGLTTTALIGPATNDGAATTCGGVNTVGTNASVQSDSGPAWWRPFQGAAPAAPAAPGWVVPVDVVRYVIATDPNDPSNPGDLNFRHLWRSATGGRASALNNYADVSDPPGGTWQLVARGINDMQIQYVDGDGGVKDEPGVFADNTQYNLVVRQVNVTLSSRVAGANIAGFSGTNMADPLDIRLGQLTAQIVPRQALVHLQTAGGVQQWK